MKLNSNQGDAPDRAAPKPNSAVIVRYKEDVPEGSKGNFKVNIELLTDHSLSKAFDDSSKSFGYTKNFQSVQTCLKSKRGIGEPIIVKFYAPNLNMSDPTERVTYDYRNLGDDVELI